MQDLFKEMFGSEDPFADFHKFFEDVRGQRWLYDPILRSNVELILHTLTLPTCFIGLIISVHQFLVDIGRLKRQQPLLRKVIWVSVWTLKKITGNISISSFPLESVSFYNRDQSGMIWGCHVSWRNCGSYKRNRCLSRVRLITPSWFVYVGCLFLTSKTLGCRQGGIIILLVVWMFFPSVFLGLFLLFMSPARLPEQTFCEI